MHACTINERNNFGPRHSKVRFKLIDANEKITCAQLDIIYENHMLKSSQYIKCCNVFSSLCCVHAVCSNGQTRLVGGANQTQGRVEVCISNTWGTICDDNWSSEDARVVCSQLGYPSGGAQSYSFAAFGKGSGPIWFSDVQCSGAEVSLQKCFKGPVGAAYCSHQEDAGVLCTSKYSAISSIPAWIIHDAIIQSQPEASAGSQPFPMEGNLFIGNMLAQMLLVISFR